MSLDGMNSVFRLINTFLFGCWLLPDKFSVCPKNNGFVRLRGGGCSPSASGSYAYAGRILSLMTLFGVVRISHTCQILSVDGACLTLATFIVPTPCQDHSRALQACIRGPPKDWGRRTGRPRQTWLRTVCARSISPWRRQGGARHAEEIETERGLRNGRNGGAPSLRKSGGQVVAARSSFHRTPERPIGCVPLCRLALIPGVGHFAGFSRR